MVKNNDAQLLQKTLDIHQNNQVHSGLKLNESAKFHQNPLITVFVIWLTNKQTYRLTVVTKHPLFGRDDINCTKDSIKRLQCLMRHSRVNKAHTDRSAYTAIHATYMYSTQVC